MYQSITRSSPVRRVLALAACGAVVASAAAVAGCGESDSNVEGNANGAAATAGNTDSPAGGSTGVGGAGGTAAAGGIGGASAGDGGLAGEGSGGDGGKQPLDPLPSSYAPVVVDFPGRNDASPCAGVGNGSAKLDRAAFAQTHLLEPTHPLFYLVAGRAALAEVAVVGTGPAPDVKVEARVNGEVVGSLCLTGPKTLPSAVDFAQHRASDRFRATLPAKWLVPGLSLTVTAGSDSVVFDESQLRVRTAPELNLIMVPVDVLNYNAGKPNQPVPEGWLADFAGAVPAPRVRLGQFPARLPLPTLVVSPDGPGGVAPVLLDKRLCDDGESPGAGCTDANVSGMNVQAAVLRMVSALHQATGEYAHAYYFGNTGHFNPGGWGGGKNFVGADYYDIFIHEMGHALSLPHWGQGPYQNSSPAPDDYRYPYGGENADGGGRGESWNYYQNVGEAASPRCEVPGHQNFGKERSDAMQRNVPCDEFRSTAKGPWDGYGDFSAYSILRFMAGASESLSGTVPYKGGNAPFNLPSQSGFPNLVIDEMGKRELVRAEDQPQSPINEERYDFLRPEEWESPVATIYGTYHPSEAAANIIYPPVSYIGPRPKLIDPTDPATFAALAAGSKGPYGDYFWWPKDMTIKVIYEDGSVRTALYPYGSVERGAALGSGPWRYDLLYFAINVPADKPIRKVELYRRPFLVRYADMTDSGNIANPSLGITAANTMAGATLVSSWTQP